MKTKVLTGSNARRPLAVYPVNAKSNTVPAVYRSARTILEHYQRGIMPVGHDVMWADQDMRFDDVDLENLRQLDLFDAEEVVSAKQAIWAEASKRLKQLQKEQAEKEEAAKVAQQQKAMEDFIAKKEAAKTKPA